MDHTLTIQLSEPVFQYFQEVADRSQRPVEQLVQQSLVGNLPPRVPVTSPALTSELLTMQTASTKELQQVAESSLPADHQQRHFELLDKNSEGVLTAAEQQELSELRQKADDLMLRKAYAWALLRWLGHPLPALEELPTN